MWHIIIVRKGQKVKMSDKVKLWPGHLTMEVDIMAMPLAVQIENYIKRLLAHSEDGSVELKRADLAQMFMCVPSQINYVLNTRFSSEAGYIIETRRGGAGYVRIVRTGLAAGGDLGELVRDSKGKPVTGQAADNLLLRLLDEGILTKREFVILRAMLCGDALSVAGEAEDDVRGRQVRMLLLNLLREDL